MKKTTDITGLLCAVAFVLTCVFFSCLGAIFLCLILNWKAEQRSNEAKAIERNVQVAKVSLFRIILWGLPLSLLVNVFPGITGKLIMAGITFVLCIALAFSYPLFAIFSNFLIVWDGLGFSKPRKYLLSDLSRKEYYKRGRYKIFIVALYQGNEVIAEIQLNDYENTKKLLELLRQIPEKKD